VSATMCPRFLLLSDILVLEPKDEVNER